jgi:hypothetical protein
MILRYDILIWYIGHYLFFVDELIPVALGKILYYQKSNYSCKACVDSYPVVIIFVGDGNYMKKKTWKSN